MARYLAYNPETHIFRSFSTVTMTWITGWIEGYALYAHLLRSGLRDAAVAETVVAAYHHGVSPEDGTTLADLERYDAFQHGRGPATALPAGSVVLTAQQIEAWAERPTDAARADSRTCIAQAREIRRRRAA